jgi:hypothetical protein|tara:strand:+ start:539 stop:820 length:282 start_codon:yes stop_codon:yes gene_type:complete
MNNNNLPAVSTQPLLWGYNQQNKEKKMEKVKRSDKRKNIYVVTVTTDYGSIAVLETHSNKKEATRRFGKLSNLFKEQNYTVIFHHKKLQTPIR